MLIFSFWQLLHVSYTILQFVYEWLTLVWDVQQVKRKKIEYKFAFCLFAFPNQMWLRMLMWDVSGWGMLRASVTPHLFDCIFLSKWTGWGEKQTNLFISSVFCLVDEWLSLPFSCRWHWEVITDLWFFLWFLSIFSSTIHLFPLQMSILISFLWSLTLIIFLIIIFIWSHFLQSYSHIPFVICICSAGTDLFSNCTEECKALGHSDRCWMPSFVPSDGRQGPDYRSNLHVPGMDATLPDTEVPSSVNLSDQLTLTSSTASSNDRSFSTFGKDGHRSQSHHSLQNHLHPQQQQYSSSTLERKEYDRGTLPYKPTFLCEYQYETSMGPYDFGMVPYRY